VSSMGTRKDVVAASSGSIKRTPSIGTSRLLAPTASSLAKRATTSRTLATSSAYGPIQSPLAPVNENSAVRPKVHNDVFSPTRPLAQITNQPLMLRQSPAGLKEKEALGSPSPAPAKSDSTDDGAAEGNPVRKAEVVQAVRPIRKPRISRSKVIARLHSQRGASGSSTSSGASGRSRSSMGAGVRVKPRGSDFSKKPRQSEVARRRSRATGSAIGTSKMAVDA
jgi:hypothetical protein